MNYITKKTSEQLIIELLKNGGKIQICKPKLAPKRRKIKVIPKK